MFSQKSFDRNSWWIIQCTCVTICLSRDMGWRGRGYRNPLFVDQFVCIRLHFESKHIYIYNYAVSLYNSRLGSSQSRNFQKFPTSWPTTIPLSELQQPTIIEMCKANESSSMPEYADLNNFDALPVCCTSRAKTRDTGWSG
jgi:hypothetical protein